MDAAHAPCADTPCTLRVPGGTGGGALQTKVEFEGIVFTNGNGASGGAVYGERDMKFTDCIFKDNEVQWYTRRAARPCVGCRPSAPQRTRCVGVTAARYRIGATVPLPGDCDTQACHTRLCAQTLNIAAH